MALWREIPGYEGVYEVSSCGKVRSLDRWVENSSNGGYFQKGRVRSLGISRNGYVNVVLSKDGENKRYLVHRLVLMAFSGLKEDDFVNHRNGDKTDNRIENLEKCTHQENMDHYYTVLGDKRAIVKITRELEFPIYFLREKGVSAAVLASAFNCHESTIARCYNKVKKGVKGGVQLR